MLTVITTVFVAMLAALQADASICANIANRYAHYLAMLASGEWHRTGLQGNYQFNVFGVIGVSVLLAMTILRLVS